MSFQIWWEVKAFLTLSTFVGFLTTVNTVGFSIHVAWHVFSEIQKEILTCFLQFFSWKNEVKAWKEIRKQLDKQKQHELHSQQYYALGLSLKKKKKNTANSWFEFYNLILVYLNGNNAAEGENNIKYASSYASVNSSSAHAPPSPPANPWVLAFFVTVTAVLCTRIKDVRAHCYWASLVHTLYMTWHVPRHVFQARAPSRNSIKYRAGDLCGNLICEYFCCIIGDPHFFSGRSLSFVWEVLIISYILFK